MLILNNNHINGNTLSYDTDWQNIIEGEKKFNKSYKELKEILKQYETFNKTSDKNNNNIGNILLLNRVHKIADEFFNILYTPPKLNDYCVSQHFFEIFREEFVCSNIEYIDSKLSTLLEEIMNNQNLFFYILEEFNKKNEIEQLRIINNLYKINPDSPLVKKLLAIYKKLHNL
jgi:hypothetical protein